MRATDYDANRHFFLSQKFRDNYDKALELLPLVSSDVNISRVEIWVTNRQASTEDFRNIVALADLGEFDGSNIGGANVNPNPGMQQDPSNGANDLANIMTLNDPVRKIATISISLTPYGLKQGRDYSVLENARRLSPEEYEVNRKFRIYFFK